MFWHFGLNLFLGKRIQGWRPACNSSREGKGNIQWVGPSRRVPRIMCQAGHLSRWKLSMGECPQYSVDRVGVRTDKVGRRVLKL